MSKVGDIVKILAHTIEANDGDFDKLDKLISEQLALISEEIEEDKKQLSFDFD